MLERSFYRADGSFDHPRCAVVFNWGFYKFNALVITKTLNFIQKESGRRIHM